MLPCDTLPWKQTSDASFPKHGSDQQMSNGGMPHPGMGKRKMSVVDRLMSAIGHDDGDHPEQPRERVREKTKSYSSLRYCLLSSFIPL